MFRFSTRLEFWLRWASIVPAGSAFVFSSRLSNVQYVGLIVTSFILAGAGEALRRRRRAITPAPKELEPFELPPRSS